MTETMIRAAITDITNTIDNDNVTHRFPNSNIFMYFLYVFPKEEPFCCHLLSIYPKERKLLHQSVAIHYQFTQKKGSTPTILLPSSTSTTNLPKRKETPVHYKVAGG
jgi:hypothetical protein